VKKAAAAFEKLASGGGLRDFSWRQRGTDPHEVDVSGFTARSNATSVEMSHLLLMARHGSSKALTPWLMAG
jgi:hypothetical protein